MDKMEVCGYARKRTIGFKQWSWQFQQSRLLHLFDFGNNFFQVDTLLGATLFSLPSYTYQDVGDVIFELMVLDRASVCHWLEASLKNLPGVEGNSPEGVPPLTPAVTRKQLVKFHKSVTTAEQSKQVSEAIREFSRLWRWTRSLIFLSVTATMKVLEWPQTFQQIFKSTGIFKNIILSNCVSLQVWLFSSFRAFRSFLKFHNQRLCKSAVVGWVSSQAAD